jgi:hypothetical protein
MEPVPELPVELGGIRSASVSLGELYKEREEVSEEVVEIGRLRAEACDPDRRRLCMATLSQ